MPIRNDVNRTQLPKTTSKTTKTVAPQTTVAATKTPGWQDAGKKSTVAQPAMPPVVIGWNKRGLMTTPEALGEKATARLSQPMSAKALAAAAFGISEAQVSPRHWRLLVAVNPELAKLNFTSGKVNAGQLVNLSSVPEALEAREKNLTNGIKAGQAMLAAAKKAKPGSADRLSDTELLTLTASIEGLKGELEQVKHSRSTRPLELKLGQAEALADAAAKRGDINAALKAFEPYQNELKALTAPEDAQRRTMMERELTLSQANAHVGAADFAATRGQGSTAVSQMRAATQTLDGLLAQKDLPLDIRTAVHSRKATVQVAEAQLYLSRPELMNGLLRDKPEPGVRDQRLKPVLAQSAAAYTAASNELKAVQTELQAAITAAGPSSPEGLALAEQLKSATIWRNSLVQEQNGVAADLHAAAGDTDGQLKCLDAALASSMGLSPSKLESLLAPDEKKRINKDAEERKWYRVDQIFSTTKVGFLSPAKLAAATAAIEKLPPARRDEALEALCRMADASSAAGDVSKMNVNRQLLNSLSSKLNLPPLKVQAAIADAEYVAATGDLSDAAKGFAAATKLAHALPQSDIQPALEARALFGHANTLQQLASTGDYKERETAAHALRGLRVAAEKSGPFARDQLSRLNMMEMSAFLGANLSQHAEQTLAHVKNDYVKAGDVPWLNETVKEFEKKNTDWGPTAFLQVALAEANSESMGEAIGYGLGGAAAGAGVGAAIGVWFFGVGAIPGAALGAMIGGATGTLGLKTRNVIRGWDKIGDAGRTGLNSQTAMTSIMDTVSLGLDVVSIVAPVKGLGSIGKVGAQALVSTGADVATDAGSRLLADLASEAEKQVIKSVGTEAAGKMAASEFQKLGKEVLLRQIARETMEFGGKKVALASLGLAATPFATELWRIQTSKDMTEAQKSAARGQLASNLGQAALTMGVMLASSSVTNHFALNPTGATKEMRAALAQISVKGQAVLVDGVQVNTVTPNKQTVRGLLKEGFVENVVKSPKWLADKVEHGAGFDDLALLQKEAPDVVKKVMGQIDQRFKPSEEHSLAFGNSSSVFNAQLDSKEFFGVCAGLTLARRRMNMLAFFDDGKTPQVEKCPFDVKTQPTEWTKFYKERLTGMVKDNKAAYLPGFANINEVSKHPLLAPIVKDLVLQEWGVNNATPYKGVYKMLGGVTKKGYTFAEATDLMKQINDAHKIGPNPVIWLSSHSESMFSTKQWIHVMEAVSATQEVPGGPITITAWDPNSTSLSGMKSTIVVQPDGKAMLGSRELNEIEVLPGDNIDVAKSVTSRMKFAIKYPTLVNGPAVNAPLQ